MMMPRRSWRIPWVTFALALMAACRGPQPAPPVSAPAAPPTTVSTPAALALTLSMPAATAPTAPLSTVSAPPAPAPVASGAVSRARSTSPRFSHPTEITNPYYPVSLIGEAISLGTESGRRFRTEVTLVPGTRTIAWDGQQIEALVSQYAAYANGKLVEVAYDFFAQSDDGGVYYLGEEVSNYRNGKVVSHEGSWLAGKGGAPPALIMPADPRVGQKFNPENLPGVAYETDEIVSLAEHTTTPAGPIDNALLIKEILMDRAIEYKVNAAGLGIVESREGNESVNLVWLNRTDAAPGTVPEPLMTIEAQAEDIIDAVPARGWEQVRADVSAIGEAWQSYRTRVIDDKVPQPFEDALAAALDRLQKASGAQDSAGALQAANDLSAAVIDLFTVYRPATPTDLGWLDFEERQLLLDVAANNYNAVADSLAKADTIWARLKPVILIRNGSDVATRFEKSLMAQQAALEAKKAPVLTSEANNSLALIDELERLF